MEGAMVKLLALSSLTKQDITKTLAKKVIQDVLGDLALKKISMKHICQVVSHEMNVSESKLYGKGRTAVVVAARHVAMFLCRELTQNSLIHIGNHFGKRDHATVIHACKAVGDRMSQDLHLNKLIDNIKIQIQ
jgi:chromosomal replication initiator protein